MKTWLFKPQEMHNKERYIHRPIFCILLFLHSVIIYLLNNYLDGYEEAFPSLTDFLDRLFVLYFIVFSVYSTSSLHYYRWYNNIIYGVIGYIYTYVEKKISMSLSTDSGIHWPEILLIILFSFLLLFACSVSYYNMFTNNNIKSSDKKYIFLQHIWPITLFIIYLLIGALVEKHTYFHLHHWMIGYTSLNLLFCSSPFVIFISQFFLSLCIHGIICYKDIPNIWSP